MNRQYRQCNHAKPNATCSFENAKSFLDMYFFVMPDRAPKIMLDDQKQKPFCRNLRHASCQQIYTCIHVYTNNNVNQTFFLGKALVCKNGQCGTGTRQHDLCNETYDYWIFGNIPVSNAAVSGMLVLSWNWNKRWANMELANQGPAYSF
jgi:hypothetical protein